MKTEYDINKRFRNLWFGVVAFIAFMAMVLGMASCKTEKWAVKKHAVIAHKYPAIPAKYCAEHFDNTEYQRDSVIIIKGENSIDTAFVTIDCDSAVKKESYFIKVPYSIKTTRVDTVIKYKYTQVVNTAKVSLLEKELGDMQDERDEMKDKMVVWRWATIILAVILFCITVIKWVLSKLTFNIF